MNYFRFVFPVNLEVEIIIELLFMGYVSENIKILLHWCTLLSCTMNIKNGGFWLFFKTQFLICTTNAPSCTWFFLVSMFIRLNLSIISWVWVHKPAPVKILACLLTLALNRNLKYQAKLQNGLCSCIPYAKIENSNNFCLLPYETLWFKEYKKAKKKCKIRKWLYDDYWTKMLKNGHCVFGKMVVFVTEFVIFLKTSK